MLLRAGQATTYRATPSCVAQKVAHHGAADSLAEGDPSSCSARSAGDGTIRSPRTGSTDSQPAAGGAVESTSTPLGLQSDYSLHSGASSTRRGSPGGDIQTKVTVNGRQSTSRESANGTTPPDRKPAEDTGSGTAMRFRILPEYALTGVRTAFKPWTRWDWRLDHRRELRRRGSLRGSESRRSWIRRRVRTGALELGRGGPTGSPACCRSASASGPAGAGLAAHQRLVALRRYFQPASPGQRSRS